MYSALGEKIITIPIATWLAFHFLVFNTSFLLYLLRVEFLFLYPIICGTAVIVYPPPPFLAGISAWFWIPTKGIPPFPDLYNFEILSPIRKRGKIPVDANTYLLCMRFCGWRNKNKLCSMTCGRE